MSEVKTEMTPAQQRKADAEAKKTLAAERKLAQQVYEDRKAGMSGAALREKYGDWLTGPNRIKLLRKHGLGDIVQKSYDRSEAAKVRQAKDEEREAKRTAKAAQAPTTSQQRKQARQTKAAK